MKIKAEGVHRASLMKKGLVVVVLPIAPSAGELVVSDAGDFAQLPTASP